MGRHENRFILIFMNFDEIIINKRKNAGKSRGNTYKVTHIWLVIALELQSYKVGLKVMLRHSTFTLWEDMKTNLFQYS